MTILDKAKVKFNNSRQNEILYNGKPFREFLAECYLNYSPASYGKYIQKKLELELYDQNVYTVRNMEKDNCGDIRMEYPSPYGFVYQHPNELYYELDTPYGINPLIMNWEFKVSFLGKTSNYTIRNLRPYQELNGGYILCFVDCENDFKEEFYLVSYEVFQRYFTLTHMNGTKDKHSKDGFENYGLSFKKNSNSHYILKRHNNLNGTKLSDLISYCQNLTKELRGEFWNTEQCRTYVSGLMEKVVEVKVRFMLDFMNQDDFKEKVEILIKEIKSEYDKILDIEMTSYGHQLLFKVKDKIAGWDYVDAITEKYDKYFSRVF
jgi:hypothetical protein